MSKSYELWDSISIDIATKCLKDDNIKCLESLLKLDNEENSKISSFYLVGLYRKYGQYEKMEVTIRHQINQSLINDVEQLQYSDYKWLEYGLRHFDSQGDYQLAEECFTKISQVFNYYASTDSLFDVFTNYRLGGELALLQFRQPIRAQIYFSLALEHWKKAIQDSIWLPPLFYDLAVLKNQNQEYEIAHNYIQEAIALANKYPGKYSTNFYLACQSLLASIFQEWHRIDESIAIGEKLIREREKSNSFSSNSRLMIDYLNQSESYKEKHSYHKALNCLDKAETIFPFTYQSDSTQIALINLYRTQIFIEKGSIDSAKSTLKNASNILLKNSENIDAEGLVLLLTIEAKIAAKENKHAQALKILIDGFSKDSLSQLNTLIKYNIAYAVDYYILLGDIAAKTNGHQLDALAYYKQADSLLNVLRINNSWRASSLYLVGHYRSLTEKILSIAFENYKKKPESNTIQYVFNLLERNKALMLNERAKSFSIKSELYETNNQLESIHKIQLEIEGLERKIIEEDNRHDKLKLDELQQEYYDQLRDLDKSYERSEVITLKQWQNFIKANKTDWIQYFVGSEYIYQLYSNGKEIYFQQLDLDSVLQQTLDSHISFHQHLSMKGMPEFFDNSYQLYNLIIPTAIQESTNSNLIIVPDGIISFLPFESLITASPDHQTNYKNAPYWLHAKNIRYGLSASLWKSTKIAAKGNLLFAEYKDDVNPLAGVAIERKKIKGYWKGRFNEVDKKQDFLSIIESSNVIHVAGHAKSDTTDNGQNQMFFCSDKNSECILKGYELAGYNLTDQLVVLNACETNYGKVWDGEGVFSLARDFAGGGALSSVSNLWLVNDQSAQSLIVSMYKYWPKRKNISSALRQSKLDYLEENNLFKDHPYFWANTVVIGDAELESNFFRRNSLWIILSIVLLLGLLYWQKRE